MTARRIARLAALVLALSATPALHAQTAAAPACTAEWAQLAGTHPAARAALDARAKAQIDDAARAHGRALLTWQAGLIEQFLKAEPARLHPVRKQFLAASAAYLRCRHAALPKLPDWQPNRSHAALPTSAAIPGDLLFTDKQCAVFLRGEVAGIPGTGVESDRMAWRWSGRCAQGAAEGEGNAELVLRSGDTQPGLLGHGFAATTLRRGNLHGRLQVTDDTPADADWKHQFDEYVNGRVTARLQRAADKSFQRVVYRPVGDDWRWTTANPKPAASAP